MARPLRATVVLLAVAPAVARAQARIGDVAGATAFALTEEYAQYRAILLGAVAAALIGGLSASGRVMAFTDLLLLGR